VLMRALHLLAIVSGALLVSCTTDPGPYMLSGLLTRASAGTPDNCLVALYDASSVSITTSLPDPVYSTTVTFSSASQSYSIDNIPSGTYYFGAFLGVDSGTAVSTAESGYGSSAAYSNPFPLIEVKFNSDRTINVGSSDWVGFP
jgi:hypothetical protein